MSRVKRFFQVAKSVLQLISKLLDVVGDTLAVIKVVDTAVDTFIAKRKEGELKDVDALTYVSAICSLVADLLPYAGDVLTATEQIYGLVDAYVKNRKDISE